MTPGNKINRDVRKDGGALYHRKGVALPDFINTDGTASQDQVANVAAGTNLALAWLPHRELGAVTGNLKGAAIVGTREPNLLPYVPAGYASILACQPKQFISQPKSQHDILIWLLQETGFAHAPWAIRKLAGWQVEWIVNFLWRLLLGGAEGTLSVAERQAACALRQFWQVFIDNLHQPNSGAEIAGGVRLGRALIDVLAALFALIDEEIAAGRLNKGERDEANALQRRLVGLVARYVRFFEQAKNHQSSAAKMRGAFKAAKEVLDIIAMFTVSDRTFGMRVKRAKTTADKRVADVIDDSSPIDDIFDGLEQRLDRVVVDKYRTQWPDKYCISLERLDNACRTTRISALKAISTRHIYDLIVTRRLDRLYAALPWMAALSGAFPGVWAGPLGAMAQLFETARAFEIVLELGSRLYDPGDPHRLDVKKGKRAYATSQSLAAEVVTETRAGFRIAEHAISHHIVDTWVAGASLHRYHPLAAAARGSLRWSIKRAIADQHTVDMTTRVELAKSIYGTKRYDKDLPAFAGLTLIPFVGNAIANIFRANLRGPAFGEHVADVHVFDRDTLQRPPTRGMPWSCAAATCELVRSVLKSADVEMPDDVDVWPAKALVLNSDNTPELRRFDQRHKAHIPKKSEKTGGAIRRNATKHEEGIGNPTLRIWHLIDQARTWREPRDGARRSADMPLERILDGQARLYGLTPIAHHPIYVLWFRPDIDRHLIEWIATGAPTGSAVWFSNPDHAAAIAGPINALRARAAPLYAAARVDRRIVDVAIILFTGFSNLMSDDAHPRC